MMSKKRFHASLRFFFLFFYFILMTSCTKQKINVLHINSSPEYGGSTDQPHVLYYKNAESLTIKAIPAEGFKVISWNIDGKSSEIQNGNTTITIDNIHTDLNIEVIFAPIRVMPTPDNPAVEDPGTKTLFLKYTPNSNANGFNMSFYNNFQNDKNPCDTVSIIVDANGSDTFVPDESEVPSPLQSNDNFKNQYSCSLSADKRIILLGTRFRPIAKQFTLKILDAIIKVKVVSAINSKDKLTLDNALSFIPTSFKGCGQSGTILQRVFDCSMLVTNYHFDSRNVDSSDKTNNFYSHWFVVSCPNGSASAVGIEKCAWLSPVITNDNPVILQNIGLTLQEFKHAYFSSARLLFSPALTKTIETSDADGQHIIESTDYNLSDAIGFDAWTYLTNLIQSSSGHPLEDCKGNCYVARHGWSTMFWQKEDESTSKEKSICGTNPSENILPKSNALGLEWRMPNYPIFILLSDEHSSFFNVKKISGFVDTKKKYHYLWSSSYIRVGVDNEVRPIFFDTDEGFAKTAIVSRVQGFDQLRPSMVRCVSLNWN